MSGATTIEPADVTAAAGRVNWLSIATYYGIACAISWPLFWFRDVDPVGWAGLDVPSVVKSWLPAFGPLIAGLAARFLFRRTHPARVTLFGTSARRSLAFLGVFVVMMAAVGIGGDQSHLDGLMWSGAFVVYAFCEETGWRGFLQDALHPLPTLPRYVLIGVLWGAWHFTTFLGGDAVAIAERLGLMSLLWIGGSWGIGTAVEATRSLTVAAMLHLTFNLFRSLPMDTVAMVLVPCVVAWVLLFRFWPAPVAVACAVPQPTPA